MRILGVARNHSGHQTMPAGEKHESAGIIQASSQVWTEGEDNRDLWLSRGLEVQHPGRFTPAGAERRCGTGLSQSGQPKPVPDRRSRLWAICAGGELAKVAVQGVTSNTR